MKPPSPPPQTTNDTVVPQEPSNVQGDGPKLDALGRRVLTASYRRTRLKGLSKKATSQKTLNEPSQTDKLDDTIQADNTSRAEVEIADKGADKGADIGPDGEKAEGEKGVEKGVDIGADKGADKGADIGPDGEKAEGEKGVEKGVDIGADKGADKGADIGPDNINEGAGHENVVSDKEGVEGGVERSVEVVNEEGASEESSGGDEDNVEKAGEDEASGEPGKSGDAQTEKSVEKSVHQVEVPPVLVQGQTTSAVQTTDKVGEGVTDNEDADDVRAEVKLDFSNSKLYRSFKNHVSFLLLRNKPQDRGHLACKQHTKKLEDWKLDQEHESVIDLVNSSPLANLVRCGYKTTDRVIISAFVERWHPETNTLHMSFGEMGITLDDVHQITGLPITGKAITGRDSSSVPEELLEEFVERVLGIKKEDVAEELAGSKYVRMEFLRRNLAGKAPETCTAEQVARGFLLYLLGCTLFQDKTGDKVHLKYLYYLEDFKGISEWAWGVAGLAHLYRELGKASRFGTKTISGYLTLLEAWVYEHFPTQRPGPTEKLTKNMLRTEQWTPRSHNNARDANKLLHSLRIHLDGLTKTDVVWTPYRKVNQSPSEVVWYTGTIMVDEIIEPYQPDRVVRQFGHVQDIPKDPMAPKRVRKSGSVAMSYKPIFSGRTDEFEKWEDHVINKDNRGPLMKTNGECTKRYDNWVRENLICRLDFSVKDPLAPVQVDEKKREAWRILDKIFHKKKATRDELFAAIGLAKDLIKPDDEDILIDAGEGSSNASAPKATTQATTQASAQKKRKRK